MSAVIKGIIIVLLLVGQVFLWRYVTSSAQALHARQTNQQQYELLSLKLLETQQEFARQQASLNRIAELLPDQDTISHVLGRMEDLAESHSVAIDVKSIEDVELIKAGSNTIIPRIFALEAIGSAQQLLAFLESLESQKQLGRIESWDIASSGAGQEGSFQSFVLRVTVIYYFL